MANVITLTGNYGYQEYQIDGLTADQAKRVSDSLDKDSDTLTGAKAWFTGGRVKTNTGAAPAAAATNVVLFVHIASN